jgi:hypothetical protein
VEPVNNGLLKGEFIYDYLEGNQKDLLPPCGGGFTLLDRRFLE